MLALCLPALLMSPPQDPGLPGAIARYRLGERTTVVARDELALEMAWHEHRRDPGRRAVQHLVNTTLVAAEAEAKGLMPEADEIRAFWEELKKQFRAAGRDPEDFAAVRNTSHEQFLADLGMQLAQKALVRAELGLTDDEPVSREMLTLWLQEARRRHEVVEDPEELPLGTVARVDGRPIPILALGHLLLRTSDHEQRARFVRQIVLQQILEARARELGIEVTEKDIERELEERRREAEANPRFRGLTFEQLLETQGLTPERLGKSRLFRAQILQEKIAAALHPDEELREELAADRQGVLDRVGPRRRLGAIYVRSLEEPNELVPRGFDEAREHLETVRERILAGAAFERVAMVETEDPASKVDGGDLGWVNRNSERLPEAVRAAAFALPIGGLSEPVRTEDGYWLIKVLDAEPPLAEGEILERMRGEKEEKLLADLLEAAEIEFLDS